MAGETDHLLEQRPLAASFAEGMRLIAKSEVLGTLEDDDDIERKLETRLARRITGHDSFRGFTRVPGKAEGTI